MKNWGNFTERFTSIYEPLVNKFIADVGTSNVEGLPELFLPVAGKNYPTNPMKIIFAGMETRGWGDMKNFIDPARQHVSECLFRTQGEFDAFDFVDWTNNFGTSFWDFVLKFQANFHGITDWKELKHRKHPEILSNFAWANLNALERFEVTAQNRGVKWEDWDRIKKASLIFDRGDHVIQAFAPDLLVVLNWADESWLTEHRQVSERIKIFDHLQYLRLKPCGTHVIWTAHPRWLGFRDFDGYVARCVALAKEKLNLGNQISMQSEITSAKSPIPIT